MNHNEQHLSTSLETLASLRQERLEYPLKALQGLTLTEPEPGQFHTLKNAGKRPEAFVLVIQVDGDACTVIPGSFEALKGGPTDMVLPRDVFGDFVTLSMDLKMVLGTSALGEGFAKLDEAVFEKVKSTLAAFEGEKVKGSVYRVALPYIGVSDSRLSYHKSLAAIMYKAELLSRGRLFAMPIRKTGGVALAAGKQAEEACYLFCPLAKDVKIRVTWSPADATYYISVFDEQGNYSSDMDGCAVQAWDSDETKQAIQNGECVLQYSQQPEEAQLVFMTADGKLIQGAWSLE